MRVPEALEKQCASVHTDVLGAVATLRKVPPQRVHHHSACGCCVKEDHWKGCVITQAAASGEETSPIGPLLNLHRTGQASHGHNTPDESCTLALRHATRSTRCKGVVGVQQGLHLLLLALTLKRQISVRWHTELPCILAQGLKPNSKLSLGESNFSSRDSVCITASREWRMKCHSMFLPLHKPKRFAAADHRRYDHAFIPLGWWSKMTHVRETLPQAL
eukprot:3014325-Amphidinium_carterae.2